MKVGVVGAGAFGTALAIALGRERAEIGLWARDPEQARRMRESGRNEKRLPGVDLPRSVKVTSELPELGGAEILLLAVPMQQTAALLRAHRDEWGTRPLVACSKGIDLASMQGPTALIRSILPDTTAAILTGPSFAADIARGLPTALTLACSSDATCGDLQAALSTPVLRLYRTTDTIGAELGGALKNVVAIGAGVVIGAGLGDSARAALMTRGFAEMTRLALDLGAEAETLAGLSGFGDLVLTCTSPQSRNFRFGMALGSGAEFDATTTVEGAATARAVSRLARERGVEMPVADMIAALIDKNISVAEAVGALLSRPLKRE